MVVERQVGLEESDCFLTEHRALWEGATAVDRHPALQVGQRERRRAVSAIGRPQQCKQSRILVNRQQGAVAQCPAFRRPIPRENPDFAEIRLRQGCLPETNELVNQYNHNV